ncbi:MAG: competence/damage-inducible protein A [Acidimicrobiaceae bacterium]|nr:competence/damage-inducible protein A [Acidimicrobiaceae bacterium]
MRVEIVAIGTELLLGQIVDTNSTAISQRLAEAGIDCLYQTRVGDNLERIVSVINIALERNDAVLVCGGLGPTQDDITREAIALVMGVGLQLDKAIEEKIRAMFVSRGRAMSANNINQALVPVGAKTIAQTKGTAPGLICPVGPKVIYAVPGVPYEMMDMLVRSVIPDLVSRAGMTSVIRSRTLRTWGLSESALSELISPRLEALDVADGRTTIAFLASGIEGIKVRITAKAESSEIVDALLDSEERELKNILGEIVFGVDETTIEMAVAKEVVRLGLTLSLAESLTGGLISARIVNIPGASNWYRGCVVSYASDIKHELLGAADGPVVSESAAIGMAEGVRKVLGSDLALAITGVAGPESQEGRSIGTVFVGTSSEMFGNRAIQLRLPGDRERVRQYATISALDWLRRILSGGAPSTGLD